MSHAAKRSAVVKELMKLPLHPSGLKEPVVEGTHLRVCSASL